MPTLVDIAKPGGAASLARPVEGHEPAPRPGRPRGCRPRALVGEYLAEGVHAPMYMVRQGALEVVACDTDPDQLFNLRRRPAGERQPRRGTPPGRTAWRSCAASSPASTSPPSTRRCWPASRSASSSSRRCRSVNASPWDFQPLLDASEQYTRNHRDVTETDILFVVPPRAGSGEEAGSVGLLVIPGAPTRQRHSPEGPALIVRGLGGLPETPQTPRVSPSPLWGGARGGGRAKTDRCGHGAFGSDDIAPALPNSQELRDPHPSPPHKGEGVRAGFRGLRMLRSAALLAPPRPPHTAVSSGVSFFHASHVAAVQEKSRPPRPSPVRGRNTRAAPSAGSPCACRPTAARRGRAGHRRRSRRP